MDSIDRILDRSPDGRSSEQPQRDRPGLEPEPLSRESTGDHKLSSERGLSSENRELRSEAESEGHSYEWPRSERLSPEPSTSQSSSPDASRLSAPTCGGLREQASALLGAAPTSRKGKSAWLKQLAGEEEIALYLVRLLGSDPPGLDLPFACLLHPACVVSLTWGRNGQIVYHDPALAWCKREFQTIPELAVTLRTGQPRQLRGLQLALWSVRLLHEARLIELEPVSVPPVTADSPEAVRRARDGFELLLRCRWFLDPGEPVPYTRSFLESWCAISPSDSRAAIYALISQGVIRKAGEAKSNFKRATSLYLPGKEEPE